MFVDDKLLSPVFRLQYISIIVSIEHGSVMCYIFIEFKLITYQSSLNVGSM